MVPKDSLFNISTLLYTNPFLSTFTNMFIHLKNNGYISITKENTNKCHAVK